MAARIVAALFVSLVIASAISAAYIWHIRCEGFGCMGVGVMWLAWAALYLLALGTGLVATRRIRDSLRGTVFMRGMMAMHIAVGAFLGIAWIGHNAI